MAEAVSFLWFNFSTPQLLLNVESCRTAAVLLLCSNLSTGFTSYEGSRLRLDTL
jgi:hypothetical protein